MLSIVIIGPIFVQFCDLNISQVIKVVYPFFLVIIPLTLYQLFSLWIDKKLAFFSVLLIIANYPFFRDLVFWARQDIAEMFLVLILLLLFSNELKISTLQRNILFIIFSFSLIVSHYATSLFLVVILIIMIPILLIGFKNERPKIFLNIYYKYPE